jgi:cytochrome P450
LTFELFLTPIPVRNNRDSTLCGYRIPAGTHILPNLYAINMDPNLWIEPEKFEPQRFLRNGKVYKPDHFIPFSVGMSNASPNSGVCETNLKAIIDTTL